MGMVGDAKMLLLITVMRWYGDNVFIIRFLSKVYCGQ